MSKNLFHQLADAAARRGLRFLIAGGHAVAVHGYARTTGDVDLLVSRNDLPSWRELAVNWGYTLAHDGGHFLQFNPASENKWPLDMMVVGEPSFEILRAAAVQREIEGIGLPVVGLNGLLALKIFALKHQTSHRVLKDMDDLLNLIAANNVNPRDPAFRDLVRKYGDDALYEKILHALG